MDKTVFIDRDGVINRDSPDYIKSWEEFHFLPGSLAAFRELTVHGYRIIIITNQSVIGRGMVTPLELDRIFTNMKAAVETEGGKIHGIFFCPHIPADQCACRKPEPGLILAARDKHGIDLQKAWMVGDSAKDILCAQNAGVGGTLLVLTGNGQKAREVLKNRNIQPNAVVDDLLCAARWIIERDLKDHD